MKTLFEPHLELSAKVMDLRLERQNLVSGNLANINTPKYKARRLDFEKDLQAALGLDARGKMARTDQQHMPVAFDPQATDGKVLREYRPRYIIGQDQVDLDKEMALMQKNLLQYNTLATVVQSSFQGVNKIISEGGR